MEEMKRPNLAVAFAMKKKRKKMAEGGDVMMPLPKKDHEPLPDDQMYAEGGDVEMGEQSKAHEMDMVDRIMMKHMPKDEPVYMSEGGRVANEDGPHPDELPNEFDDLALRDNLKFSYDAKNSGDEMGSKLNQEDDGEDMVARIMKKMAR